MATISRWTGTAKGLHWLVALLILAVWAAVECHNLASKGSVWQERWIMLHFSIGLTILAAMILRLYWRARHPAPADIGNPWQRKLSKLTHVLLYFVVLAMPLLGFFLRQLSGKPIDFYGLYQLPQLVTPDKALAKQVAFFHEDVFWYLLLSLVAVHVAGGLWHHFIDRDNTLRRMLPGRRR